jgi:hypothetical protein
MIVLASLGIVMAACASAGGGRTSQAACALPERDSAFLLGRPVYRECGVDRQARRLTANVRPDFRPATPRSTCYSTDLEFVVDSTGKPEVQTARILRANDQEFGASMLATLPSWKYEPATRDRIPVRQIVTEHKMLSTMVVVVPKGSSPPSAPSQRPSSC